MDFNERSCWHYLMLILPILFFEFVGISTGGLSFINVPELFIFAIYVPLIEEAFKLFVSKCFSYMTSKIIASFALFELAFVKVPIIWTLPTDQLAMGIGFALPAFAFHIATAFAYSAKQSKNRLLQCFFAMTALHMTLNFLAWSDIKQHTFYIGAGLLSFLPYCWLYVTRSNEEIMATIDSSDDAA
jgi:hypothetical protein